MAKTIQEMADAINEYCEHNEEIEVECDDCPIEKQCNNCFGGFLDYPDECLAAYEIISGKTPAPTNNTDNVDHPSHYNREGSMECIEEMRLIFGDVAVQNFCLCNAWKYRYRASSKNGAEDLEKADWYIKKYKELKELKYRDRYTQDF